MLIFCKSAVLLDINVHCYFYIFFCISQPHVVCLNMLLLSIFLHFQIKCSVDSIPNTRQLIQSQHHFQLTTSKSAFLKEFAELSLLLQDETIRECIFIFYDDTIKAALYSHSSGHSTALCWPGETCRFLEKVMRHRPHHLRLSLL